MVNFNWIRRVVLNTCKEQVEASGAQPTEDSQLVSQLVSQCVTESVGEPMNQSGGLSAKYSISQSAGHLVIWLVSQTGSRLVGRSMC